jgi:hypothetical protein
MTAELDALLRDVRRAAWREHAEADCQALARVWALTRVWESRTWAAYPDREAMLRGLAREVRAAITGEEGDDGQAATAAGGRAGGA